MHLTLACQEMSIQCLQPNLIGTSVISKTDDGFCPILLETNFGTEGATTVVHSPFKFLTLNILLNIHLLVSDVL
jgi:hypothetical protein